MTPIRDVVRPLYRPMTGRLGPPPIEREEQAFEPLPLPEALTPIEFRAFDYTALDDAMAHLDAQLSENLA
jgi:hypothetical protein